MINTNKKEKLREYRCPVCNKLLFIGLLSGAKIEIKCRNCRIINKFSF